MTVQWARNGDVDLAYETFGSPGGEPLLLITGQGAQMVAWTDEFCGLFAERGFHVVRFDNRDSGLSTHFTSARKEHPLKKLLGRGTRPYTGADLSDDAVAVVDAIGWSSAHVVGGSMGGTIGQATALRHPGRVRTLTSIGAPRGDRLRNVAAYANFRTLARLSRLRPPRTDEEAIEQKVEIFRILGSPGYPFDEGRARWIAAECQARRPVDPTLYQRQSGAGWPGGSLHDIRVPTLVIHGEADPMIRPRAGRAIANAIPGARFVSYPGMGHDVLVGELWPSFIDEISALTATTARQ
ncbi:alpha/beta fold hydrolase [Haloactinomyces albus]|uniref:Pimeloyl-ACP methyl ester carboxylesterase n=1 Tax=Haloactinomyces albus TaxID=1352928 RepID=A0AAE3Z8X2_9ACTN|nr:alpha/beta hydrolase [Haloactinomyces albus]MDR7300512.1 pimeloyl-ACP methyl ester carboxylesterase [Haloactinomyces albus]